MRVVTLRSRRSPRRLLFVTGGTGFLGRHVVESPATESWQLVAPSSASLDLRNEASVDAVIGDWRPNAIIHTAYRVDDRAAIVDASVHVARAAARVGARLVHVSTDVVFPGRQRPYVEGDLPAPTNDYGRAKADAERAVAEACPGALIARTSLLLGGSRASAQETMVRDAITGTKQITFFTDEIRCPVLVDDVAAALVELAQRNDVTGPLHLAGPRALSRADLARQIAHRHGWDAGRLRVGPSGDANRSRPGRVVLDSSLARSLGIGLRGPADP
jgi:dTDP-4-dehydrorhamnose reductase